MIIKIEVIYDDSEKDSKFKAFKGDELTSPEQEAVLFLQEQDQDKREF